MTPPKLKVLMVAAEAVPYVKTGGLADVIGSLPAALAAQGCDVRIALPFYSIIDRRAYATRPLANIACYFDAAYRRATVHESLAAPQPTYLIETDEYFARPHIYGDSNDILRFGFFCRAVLEFLKIGDWQPDIVHCHDWHSGLLPVYFRSQPRRFQKLKNSKTVFSIHNLAYQGVSPAAFLPRLGLDAGLMNPEKLEYYGKINPMKGGLVFSDALGTVSPNYAREIQTPAYGAGLEGVLFDRRAALHGILNGIDYETWNPLSDANLAAPYGPSNFNGKAACKRDLLRRMKLPATKKPVIGIVSRLSEQKGFDIIEPALKKMLTLGCCLVVLGSGDEHYLQFLKKMQLQHPESLACSLGKFNNELAHQIYAGCDMFLMPSRFEPCGLGQMIALAYGTVPIVRATGGLVDSVTQFNPRTGKGCGFVFKEYTAQALLTGVRRAIACYGSDAWPQLVRNTFDCDFSWNNSARQYMDLYRQLHPTRSGTRLKPRP